MKISLVQQSAGPDKDANVARALALFAEGATIPFLARYRKEATGGMDEVQLGALKEAIYRDLIDRIRTDFERGA